MAFSQPRFERTTVGLDELVNGSRSNAMIGWIAVICVALAAAANLLRNPSIWGGFALLLLVVLLLPALATRNWTTMAPWPIVSIATIAVFARLVGLYPDAAGHVAITALALVIVVELDSFTPIQLSRRFAVGFAVLTTMAIEAIWIIVQFGSDHWLGTSYLTTQTALQRDIVAVTVVSLAVGVVFYWYLIRHEQPDSPNQKAAP